MPQLYIRGEDVETKITHAPNKKTSIPRNKTSMHCISTRVRRCSDGDKSDVTIMSRPRRELTTLQQCAVNANRNKL